MKMRFNNVCFPALRVVLLVFGALGPAAHADSVEHVVLETFQIVEMVPNTPLDETEEVKGSSGTLVRSDEGLHVILSTGKLPQGAYTFWWHLTHLDGEVSILWAGYAIVSQNGRTVLNSPLDEGEDNAPGDIFIGHGLQPGAAHTVAVELWVRNHGPLSDDPTAAEEQLTQPFGGCTDPRNPNPRPDDYPCWNPQRAVFGNGDSDDDSDSDG